MRALPYNGSALNLISMPWLLRSFRDSSRESGSSFGGPDKPKSKEDSSPFDFGGDAVLRVLLILEGERCVSKSISAETAIRAELARRSSSRT